MTQEQEIRAKALEIATLLKKPESISLASPGVLVLPEEFWFLVQAVEKYIQEGK